MDGPRACRESDFDEVMSLINRVFREGTDQDIRTDYPLVFNPSMMEYMRILKVNDKVVAHVPVAPREVVADGDGFMIGVISPTVTHPDYRRRGYATRCLRDCIRIMEDRGWAVSALWTEEATFPFYQGSGYEAVGTQGWIYRLRPDEQDLFEAGGFEVLKYDPASARHLDAIMRLHDVEPHRIVRSRSDYQALFSLLKTSTYLAVTGQDPLAYLMFGEGVNKPGLIEGGGDVEGLEALVKHVLMERGSGGDIQAFVHLTPSALGRLLEAKKPAGKIPVEEAEGVGPQMMRVNSMEKLLRGIENHLRRKSVGIRRDVCLICSDTGEATTLRFRDGDVGISAERSADPVVLTRRQLAQLIFGPRPATTPPQTGGPAGDVLGRVFPFYFPIWELDHS